MSITSLDGKRYAEMLASGCAYLSERAEEINALNVFPVADGDTGTNMEKTLAMGLSELCEGDFEGVSDVSKKFAHGVLLGARGNSGVILSQIFAGINETLSECGDSADAPTLAVAYKNGIKRSYAAVTNPTEGTILTVFRESAEYAAENTNADTTIEEFYELIIAEARRSLERTKEILPVLAEEDVVDSGAMGYLTIAEGMYDALMGRPRVYMGDSRRAENIDISRFGRDSVLEFGYCTEFLLRLMDAKVEVDSFDIGVILRDLDELSGESVVAYKEGDIVKVHVHTFTPGDILSRMQKYGEFLTVKIENMSLGHSGEREEKKDEVKKKRKNTRYSVVTVASGEGLSALFTELGADVIISGGQTSNPSVEEFVSAFAECDTPDIIVLPNNKNVILAAEGAAKLTDGKRVHIIETKNIPEGYAAISVIAPVISDMEVMVEGARRAARSVTSAEITRAVRDAKVEGVSVKTGDYMAISGGEIVATASSADEALLGMLGEIDTDDFEIMTLFVGAEVSDDDRAELTERIEEEYPDLELTVHIGGQGVYDYLVSLE